MAEESHVIRGINWREVFPFTHLFRTFRIAIHPSKLFLALAAVLALYLGGRILDGIWLNRYKPLPGEIHVFERTLYPSQRATIPAGALPPQAMLMQEELAQLTRGPVISVADWRTQQREAAQRDYARLLRELTFLHSKGGVYEKLRDDREEAQARAAAGDYAKDVAYALRMRRDIEISRARNQYNAIVEKERLRTDEARRDLRATVAAEYQRYFDDMRTVRTMQGVGIFSSFLQYQTSQIDGVVQGVIRGDWLSGNGVMWSVIRFFTVGPAWMITHHWFFFLLFAALFLVIWSTFGGAISRIAAVHVADDGRKLSIRQGLSFSISKFLSFLSAPLIPLMIVLLIGVALALAGLVLFGLRLNIVVGLFFFVALAAAIVMTLAILGTAGGFGLMYPTIAVEGSDSFDAISRAFSYVYAQPWRMLFYSLVALVYGALTYLFVRLFIWLTLMLAWFFVGLWVTRDAVEGVNLWNAMYPAPSFMNLPYDVGFAYMSGYSAVAAFFIAFWNYLLIAMLGAFAISFYLSANTIIYYLMRREVDATEMDDVYLEQPEEDFVETPTSAAEAAPASETQS